MLVRCGSENGLSSQVQSVLAENREPQFELGHFSIGEAATPRSRGHLSSSVAAFRPALNILIYEAVPKPESVSTVLNSMRVLGYRPASLIVAPAESSDQIAHLLRLGVADVWLPPFRVVEMLGRVSHWLERAQPEEKETVQRLKERLGLNQFVGDSPALVMEIQKIPALALHNISVLIRGETGTGKEICARSIHYLSPRCDGPFIPVNCGALPLDLIENELFGHASGAYTGANDSACGLIEQADKGTLFLDEIDSLPLPAQVKLLRFLQDKQYRPVGGQRFRAADVRVLAATNMNLETAIREGRFRRDLFYRLNVAELTLPPLRDRAGDVRLLAQHFIKKYATEFGKSVVGFTSLVNRKLVSYSWPGNVRELENAVARATVLSPNNAIELEDLPLPSVESSSFSATFKARKAQAIESFETTYLREILQLHGGNISRAADEAGKDRRAFWELLRKHHLLSSRPLAPRPFAQ